MFPTNSELRRYAYAIIVVSVLSRGVFASIFNVNPVRVEFSAKHTNAVVQIENMSDDHVLIQARAVTWNLQGNADQYDDTDDILLNPPIFSLEPHQKQFVRLGLRRGNESAVERTYRLILEEVPEKPKPGFSGFNTVLRISVPVFAAPRTRVAPEVTWRAERTAAGIKIVGANKGSAHIQLTRFDFGKNDSLPSPVSRSMTEYLLPGQRKEWEFSSSQFLQAREIVFTVKTDAGEIHETLIPLQP